jgi:CheY-like chemotaxis protein
MEPTTKVAQIVLIEDNPADTLLVQIALKENGIIHNLTAFGSGVDAANFLCSAYKERQFVPDAILLDLHTPRCDGFEILSRLRECYATVPIAVVSSSRARSDRNHAELAGALYVEKPSNLEAFIKNIGQSVKEMLSSGSSQRLG